MTLTLPEKAIQPLDDAEEPPVLLVTADGRELGRTPFRLEMRFVIEAKGIASHIVDPSGKPLLRIADPPHLSPGDVLVVVYNPQPPKGIS